MSLFQRNLIKCNKTIVIEDRDEKFLNGITAEVFTNPVTQAAIVKTPRGVSVFDSTNTERAVTHEICIAAPRAVSLESITANGGPGLKAPPIPATVTTSTPHGLKTGFVGTISGADQPEYNLADVTITVTSDTTFTYLLIDPPDGDAEGDLVFTYLQDYTAENWVTLKGKRLKILSVLNCCEKDETLRLFCTSRGVGDKIVNQA